MNTLPLVVSSLAAATRIRRKASAIFLAGLFTGALDAQLLTLPDSHNLVESPIQAHAPGSLVWWGTAPAGGHFQVRYNASHFLSNGVGGPIGITHLRFRGEDTEHNVGGQTFMGVMASVYATTLAAAPLAPLFGANLAPALPDMTIPLGAVFIPALIVAPSLGTAPNNYIIDLDFTMGPPLMPFDPTGGFGPAVNLLVDVSWMGHVPAPDPQMSTMIPTQDTSPPVALIGGSGLYGPAGAAAGVVTAFPPVMQVEFFGPGGYPVLIAARNERIGAACGATPSAFYQEFAHGQYFDLGDPGEVDGLMGLTLTPDVYPGPSFYTVSGGAGPLNMFGIPGATLSTADNATLPFALPPGITFEYPGGPPGGTPLLHPATNGYVWLDPAVMELVSDPTPTVAEFLGALPAHLARVAPFWHDFHCGKNAPPLAFGLPGSGLYAINDFGAMETVVTWFMVGRFNSVLQVLQESHTMQCSFNWLTGVIEFRYGMMDEIWGSNTPGGMVNGITGFTRGNIFGFPSANPRSRDLSIERGPFSPFSTMVELVGGPPNMGLSAASMPFAAGPVYGGRMFPGQALTWTAEGVPAGSLVGALFVDLVATRPGFGIPGIFAPGCMWSTGPGAMILEVTLLPPPVAVGVVPIAVPPGYIPGLLGVEIVAQYAATDFVAPPVLSNALLHTVGLR